VTAAGTHAAAGHANQDRSPVNKPLWICSLLGAAVGITLGLAVFDSPFLGFALGLGVGALVGAGVGSRR
jgi:hypothetical protein